VIEFDGNEGSPHRMTLTEPDGTPVFDVLAVEDELEARRKRQDETRERADEMRRFILTSCQDLNGKETAEKLAGKFGGTVSTHASQLSRKAYGVERIDGHWRTMAA
jgi:hypothetical protein